MGDTHRHSTFYISTMYRYTAPLYTTSVQTTVHCFKTCPYLLHLRRTHYAWISCTTVHLYCSPVSVRLYCQFVLTDESPSKITFMNRVDQSQLGFLGILSLPPSHKLNHSVLTTSFPRVRVRDVVKMVVPEIFLGEQILHLFRYFSNRNFSKIYRYSIETDC